jgi:transcription antitermination factor NusG
MKPASDNYLWFALQTRSRYEHFVAAMLSGKGYEPFLPVYTCRRRWSDRIKDFELPLFPGYLFCRFDPRNRLPILMTPGVIQVVGAGKTPVPVDEGEITAIQILMGSGLPGRPWAYLQVGQRVRIERGPLAGVEGTLTGFRGRYRLVMSVTLLQRSVAVEVEGAWIDARNSSSARGLPPMGAPQAPAEIAPPARRVARESVPIISALPRP